MIKKLHKAYYKMNKKELRERLLFQINGNIKIVSENTNLVREKDLLEKSLDNEKLFLKQAENALKYKDWVIDKYKRLLEVSIEE